MFVNLNIPSFGKLLRKYVNSFRNRLETSDNIIIHGIYLSQLLLQSGISMATRQNLTYAKCSGTTKKLFQNKLETECLLLLLLPFL